MFVTSDPVISNIIEKDVNRQKRHRQLRVTSRQVDISPLLRDFKRDESGEDEDDGDDDGEKDCDML